MVVLMVFFGNYTREGFPWIFEKRNRPSLVISTLEAFAMLVALKLRFGRDPDPDDTRVLIVPSISDNRGNGAALNKLMSTRFPSSAVLMELASFMKARRMRAVVEWASRECNREADLLANGITDQFDPKRPMQVSAPEALSAGREAEQAPKRMKETHKLPNRGQKQRKRRVESRLKVTDPW